MTAKVRAGPGILETLAKGASFLLPPTPEKVFWINFAITNLCNSRCVTCNIWKKYRVKPNRLPEELTPEEIRRVFSGSRCLKHLQGIGITGGEPFLRKDFVEVAGALIEHGPRAMVSVATNGLASDLILSRTKEVMQRYRPRSFSVSISLNGVGGPHEGMMGVEGSYQRTLRTIKLLLEQTEAGIGVDFTVTPDNYPALMETYELARKLGLKFLATFAHNSSLYYGNEDTKFNWKEGDIPAAGRLLQRIASARARDEGLLLRLVDPYPYFLSKAAEQMTSRKRRFKCYSGTHSLFLNPYGDVYPCLFLDDRLGNVREGRFDDIWLSAEAGEVRRRIRAGGCRCWAACEAVPSLFRRPGIVRWNLARMLPGAGR